MDKVEKKYLIEKKTKSADIMNLPTSWLDGRVVFKRHDRKWAKFFFGICHFSMGVFACTPLDYPRPTMITSIAISPHENYCEKAYSCLNFTCKLNKFDKDIFTKEFADCGSFSLGLPLDLGSKPLWFSVGEWKRFWQRFILDEVGGIIRYDKEKGDKVLGK